MVNINHEMSLPVAPVLPVKKLKKWGEVWEDEYFYFRSEKYRKEVLAYLKAENSYFKQKTEHHQEIKKQVEKEIKKRVPERDSSVPVKIGDYYYYSRTEKGKNYSIHCRRLHNMQAPEEITLDVNLLAKGKKCCMVGGLCMSPDHRYLAYGVNFSGGITYQIRIQDLAKNTHIAERFSHTDGDMIWAEDGEHFFYTKQTPKSLRSYRIMRHKLGTPVSEDVVVYEEKDPVFSCGVWKTKSDQFIVIETSSSDTDESHFVNAHTPCESFKCFLPRQDKVEYSLYHIGDYFYILINQEGATNFKIMRTKIEHIDTSFWEEIIAHDPERIIEEVEEFQDHLVILERHQAQLSMRIFKQEAGRFELSYDYNVTDKPHTLGFTGNPNIQTDTIRLSLATLTLPYTVLELNLNTLEKKVLKTQKVAFYDPEAYDSKRIWVEARDGALIPLSLVWKKNMQTEGVPNRLLLRGYGAYGCSADGGFRASQVSLLDRGFICAFAHVRGGGELGQKWYDGGRLFNKKNSFYDFIDCAHFLFEKGYTTPEQLVVSGGSAGGLLVGAVLNIEPHIACAAMLEVPFVDVLATMLDPSLPLTTGEYPEWGNPQEESAFHYIKSYSPYDNLRAVNYPTLCVTSSINDEQVSFSEAAKYVARLRRLNATHNAILFYTDLSSGHLGATGRNAEIKEIAKEYAFYLSEVPDNGLSSR